VPASFKQVVSIVAYKIKTGEPIMTTITIGNQNTTEDLGVVTNSTVNVGNGDDNLTFDPGSTNDIITIGQGDDTIVAAGLNASSVAFIGNGDDTVTLGSDDTLTLGNGVDTITAGSFDTISVGNGGGVGDTITAGSNDTIAIGNGNNDISAGANTIVTVSKNNDNGNNTIDVGAGSTVSVGNGDNAINAGTSNTITIGAGDNAITYGGLTPQFTVPASLTTFEDHPADFPGTTIADTAVSTVALPITIGAPALGKEIVNGFNPLRDTIKLDIGDFANFAAVMADASQVGADTVITLDPGDTITLTGVAKSSLTAADFTFFNGAASDVITISGVPDGSTLSAGKNDGGGTWTLTSAQLAGLQLIAGEPTTTSTPATLTVEVTNPAAQAAQSVSTSETIKLTINPVPPHVAVGVTGNVAGETDLQISSQTDDPDGGNDYINRIALSGVPATGVTLSTPTTINTTGHPGTFATPVDVSAPNGTFFTLGITAYSDETSGTGGPTPEVSSSTSQVIDIPQAKPDSVTTLEDVPITIPISVLASDANPAANLKITSVTPPAYGTVSIATDGQSLTYNPGGGPNPLDYETNNALTGDAVAFNYTVTNALGGTNSNTITATETPVADTPSVKVSVLSAQPGDSPDLIRLGVTATSGDFGTVNNGSDFIQSLGLSLTGNNTSGFTITDTKHLLSGTTITTIGQPGLFTDEIDILAPAGQNINDNLGITAFNEETELTGSPATASAATNQAIGIDFSAQSTNLDFQTTDQSIWSTGAAFTKTFSTGFLGVDTSKHGSTKATVLGTTVASAGGSIHFKAGFEAGLHITAGDISADLPFEVTLDSTYNKTTDTLQIAPAEMQLGGGTFTEHGPGGSVSFQLDLGLNASGHATALGIGPSFSTGTIGSFTKPVFQKTITSATAAVHIPIGPLTLTLAFPTVNVNGSNPAAGPITGKGTSQDAINLAVDLVALAGYILTDGATDPTDLSLGPLSADLLDILVGFGLNLVQGFNVSASGLTPTLTLADGTNVPFSLTSPTTIPNISSHGVNSNGTVSFNVGVTPNGDVSLSNNTAIGANLTAEVQALGLKIGPIGGFLFDTKGAIQLGTFPPLFNQSFPLQGFNSHNINATV
jgi:hypothetical protein